MSVKKALDILREPIRPTTDAIHTLRLAKKIKEARIELEAVQEAQSKPEPGEFTKDFRQLLKKAISDFVDGDAVGDEGARVAKALLVGEEACKRIDRQAEQLNKMKRMVEIPDLLKDGFLAVGQELIRRDMQIAAKDKEIERLRQQVQESRCPCGGWLEGVGYYKNNVIFQCVKCKTQLSIDKNLREQALKGGD